MFLDPKKIEQKSWKFYFLFAHKKRAHRLSRLHASRGGITKFHLSLPLFSIRVRASAHTQHTARLHVRVRVTALKYVVLEPVCQIIRGPG